MEERIMKSGYVDMPKQAYDRDDILEALLPTQRYAEDVQEEEPACKNDNKIRNFSVRELNFGYVIDVGCHSFAIETPEKLTQLIGEYLTNPKATEKKWFKNQLEGLTK